MGNVKPLSTRPAISVGCVIAILSVFVVLGLSVTGLLAFVQPEMPGSGRQLIRWGLALLVAVLLAMGGVVGIALALRRGPREAIAPKAAKWLPDAAVKKQGGPIRPMHARPGPVTLVPSTTARGRFLALLVFALIWNGIVSVFAFNVVKDWAGGAGDACATAFLVPFVLIGAAVIVWAFHSLLAMFNPRPVVTLGTAGLALGESTELAWEFVGRHDRIRRLVIRLEGREEATYRRGTDTVTDKAVFAIVPLVETTNWAEIRRGKTTVTVPSGTMHSLSMRNNKVVWEVKMTGEVRNWPDVSAEFGLVVRPQDVARV